MGLGWVAIATLLALAGGVVGILTMRGKKTGRSAFWWMVGVFAAQSMALGWRGELRGQCPLGDLGEVCLFLAWSLTLFYLVTGTAYRVSLLGVFTAPLVARASTAPGIISRLAMENSQSTGSSRTAALRTTIF